MTISQYAKLHRVSYRTVWNWHKAGKINTQVKPNGTIIVKYTQDEEKAKIVRLLQEAIDLINNN